ncbi:exo-rhamnogalacturonan lyase family protein [Gracilibacillus massiliensis]|uniref:exo-rhamnogalacturonan lyase family protein n=1 Tax=Gracilibacillus massiliensis TaxID=1564956 RepID=UPI00071D450C|nr:hypothetical protein [Gracilibacillus massiliensis]
MKLYPLFCDTLSDVNETVPITWGVPWKKGELKNSSEVRLANDNKKHYQLQSKNLAYWPDGSVKWTKHSANIPYQSLKNLSLTIQKSPSHLKRSTFIKEISNGWQVRSGRLTCFIPKDGEDWIQDVSIDQKKLIEKGTLILALEEQNQINGEVWTRHIVGYSRITNVSLEEDGQLKSMIKLSGIHQVDGKKIVPFMLRVYFYHEQRFIRYVHTFHIDDNITEKLRIKGIGTKFSNALTGKPYNKQIRVATEMGWYNEATQLLLSRKHRNSPTYQSQINGELVRENQENYQIINQANKNAIWNHFRLMQTNEHHYEVLKSTGRTGKYIRTMVGSRARGGMYVGGENGGILLTLKDFWQKHPSSIDVKNLSKDKNDCIVWFWSNQSNAMNLEHYTDQTHVESAYEGFDELRATATGIANTSEGAISLFSQQPSNEELDFYLQMHQNYPLLHCDPIYYEKTQACGAFSAPKLEHPVEIKLEKALDDAINFYLKEIEQRNWYGFWDYGDIMHSYDPVRHQWFYDVGGYAWQNTELVPNLWLWFSFMRKPSEKLFTMAEAMTRHTSEVDQYHFGEYQGFGSRHNVNHWGCGCKEARISMASLHKYYFYLTGDERVEEVIDAVKDIDQKIDELPPMREFYDKKGELTPIRVGPDWAAFLSNWIYQWEKNHLSNYQTYIQNTVKDVQQAPYQLLSGPVFYYQKENHKLIHMDDGTLGDYHMVIAFGAPQVWLELDTLLNDEEWRKMVADFGSFYHLTDNEMKERTNGKLQKSMFAWPMFATGLTAYAAWYYQNDSLAAKVWEILLKDPLLDLNIQQLNSWKTISESENISTNGISQWCLNVMMCLKLIRDYLPNQDMQESDKQ